MPTTTTDRRLHPGRFLALFGFLAVLAGGSVIARAQDADTSQAKERFERGVTEYEAGKYAVALDDFQEAYRLKPHPLVRVNIANCYDKLDRPVEAIFHFDLFLTSKEGSPAQREEIKAALKSLRKRVGKLALSVSPDGTRVLIDGAEERRAPIMEPIALKVGQHELSLSLEGYDTLLRSVEIKAESTTDLSLRLTRPEQPVAAALPPTESQANTDLPPAEPVATTPQEPAPLAAPAEATAAAVPERGHDHIPLSVWIAGGTTLGLAVTGTITGLLANAAEDNFNENAAARFNPRLSAKKQAIAWQYADNAANRATALAVTTDVLFIGAIAGAAVTVYLYLSRDRDGDRATLQLQHGAPTLHATF